jgi:pimeloyl-ACP methyl ester carboxylesterase
MEELRAELADIGVHPRPVLLLWGEQDVAIPLSCAHQMLELLPQARLVTIPQGSHLAVAQRPVLAAHTVVSFLQQQQEDTGQAERAVPVAETE